MGRDPHPGPADRSLGDDPQLGHGGIAETAAGVAPIGITDPPGPDRCPATQAAVGYIARTTQAGPAV